MLLLLSSRNRDVNRGELLGDGGAGALPFRVEREEVLSPRRLVPTAMLSEGRRRRLRQSDRGVNRGEFLGGDGAARTLSFRVVEREGVPLTRFYAGFPPTATRLR